MRASERIESTARRVRFRVEQADEIATAEGLTTQLEKAAYFDVTNHNWSKVINGTVRPGEAFIAAVLGSHPDDPRFTFENLFEVIEVAA